MTETMPEHADTPEELRDERRQWAIHLVEAFAALFLPSFVMVLVMVYALYRSYEMSHGFP